ncbi:ankyrin repeat domain-containing protein [Aspergillus mulundensis]|uniref:Uncharacterized protein n=1 Tax=Aspergillus mulundensis TaxID=1810919 RepID=A0A3D8SLI9_9EURO|nr:Uncharacterized protein DSM5745_03706 [Aspergillus mulundensis]RDW87064.1 Uncharacterized protein DSM5745_03706 [Aspergillus mulundensis]
MDVLPPTDLPPIGPGQYPQPPTRTSPATLDQIHDFLLNGDIQRFRQTLDSPCCSSRDFNICDLSAIMVEAIKRNNLQFIQELLARGLPMNPLYALRAIEAKATSALDVFIQSGWDINQPVSELRPPVLGDAIADEEMTSWLLGHGADPNRRCVIDLTPLSLAVESAPLPIISLMLSHGGNVRQGQLLHHAVQRQSDTVAVLRLLIEKGAPVNACMYDDYPSWALFHFMGLGTALHKAAELGHVDAVRYLISQGADRRIKDANGRTAMECARMSDQQQVIEALNQAE